MPISVACPCGKQLRAKDSHAGRTARCPQCRKPVRIPVPSREVAIPSEGVSSSPIDGDAPGGFGLDHQVLPASPGRTRRPSRAADLLYVHMDRDGLRYYRERRVCKVPVDSGRDVEVLGTSPLAAVSPDEILGEINRKRGAACLAPLFVAVGIGLAVFGSILVGNAMIALAWPCFVASIAAFLTIPWARWRDRGAITTNLIYLVPDGGLGENMQEGVRKLFQTFAGTHATWCIDTQHHHGDWKRNGGAGRSVGRRRIRAGLAVPPRIRTNALVGYLEIDHRRYYFFPDRILAYLSRGVESVSYDKLSVAAGTTRFVESESVPADAQVVGQTWL